MTQDDSDLQGSDLGSDGLQAYRTAVDETLAYRRYFAQFIKFSQL